MSHIKTNINPVNALLFIFAALLFSQSIAAQPDSDEESVAKAALGYIEGFYEGDTAKLSDSLKPTLFKYGFWKKENSDKFEHAGHMSFEQALGFAKDVKEKKKFPKNEKMFPQ